MEPFEVVLRPQNAEHAIFDDYKEMISGKAVDIDIQLLKTFRAAYPDLTVTSTPTSNASLLGFAAAGHATAELDIETESVVRWRGFIPPSHRGGTGSIGDAMFFAKYHYIWGQEDFILYTVVMGLIEVQYILKEPRNGETTLSNSSVTDALLSAIGALASKVAPAIYVFDGYWTRSTELWDEVQKATWDKVILDPKMKKELTSVSNKFFDSKEIYKEYAVPWKRGLIYHGPPGNGKTISIKALMHSMSQRDSPIPTLYVKSARYTYMIGQVFQLARAEAPCLLVLEDIDTIVTDETRSYFFNEVDGLAGNDGILMVASTNHLDKLDPGLSKRPSRFDRKYLFPSPNKAERELYCEYWREKVKDKPVDFPKKLCSPIAGITHGFSFAYMQEAFMASLLVIARGEAGDSDEEEDNSKFKDEADLNKYELWRVMKKQVKILRDELGDEPAEDINTVVEKQRRSLMVPPPPPPRPRVTAGLARQTHSSFPGSKKTSSPGLSYEETRLIEQKNQRFQNIVDGDRGMQNLSIIDSMPGSYLHD